MLLVVGMCTKIQTKIQNQANIFQHPDHIFQRKVLMSASKNNRKRKTLGILIAVNNPTLSEQKDSKKLTLFRNDVI